MRKVQSDSFVAIPLVIRGVAEKRDVVLACNEPVIEIHRVVRDEKSTKRKAAIAAYEAASKL